MHIWNDHFKISQHVLTSEKRIGQEGISLRYEQSQKGNHKQLTKSEAEGLPP